jgi:hypothetical protein
VVSASPYATAPSRLLNASHAAPAPLALHAVRPASRTRRRPVERAAPACAGVPPLPVAPGAVVGVARLHRSPRLPEETDAEDAGHRGNLPGHAPSASITFNPLQPADQPPQDGADVRRRKQTEPLAVEVSHYAVVDEQGIRRRPIGPPQRMHVAAEAISHARPGDHNER